MPKKRVFVCGGGALAILCNCVGVLNGVCVCRRAGEREREEKKEKRVSV